MKKTAIIHANIIQKDHYIPDGILIIEDGRISDFGELRHLGIPEDAAVIDAGGDYLGPGLIDIHTHANHEKFFFEDPEGCAREHLIHGTTSVYPALYFSAGKDRYLADLKLMKETSRTKAGRNIRGVYMEGPYLNPKYGCDKENCPWKGPILPEDYEPIIEEASDFALVWCVAPEREHILDYVKAVRKVCPDAVFSVAHSEASPEQVEELIPYGLHIGTHHTDAVGAPRIFPDPEIRSVGVEEAVNNNDSIFAELIVDSRGIHVAPYMLRLIRKIKGDERIILISDAYAANGEVPEGYDDPFDINFDPTGEIAGSSLTLDVAMRNMMIHTGASVVEVFRYTTCNPAKATHITDRGEIRKGLRADLVICDEHIHIKKVFLDGEPVA